MDWWILRTTSLTGARRGATAVLGVILGVAGLAGLFGQLEVPSWLSSARAQIVAPNGGLDVNRLWQAQPLMIAQELNALQPRVPGRPNFYGVAVAAQGSQLLFSREATLALQVTAARFRDNYRGGVLLSNGVVDLPRHPIATQDTIAAMTREIGRRMDTQQDVAVIYLASHGAPEAFIATDLPTRRQLAPISSKSLAEALTQAGIKRRVIIISACFAGSWIPALASDDTIIITAAAKDRTSFGCDDTRRLTFFGEAFLEGPLARGASLRDAFETARTTVAVWEKRDEVIPSLPQAYVGRNMQMLWTQGIPWPKTTPPRSRY